MKHSRRTFLRSNLAFIFSLTGIQASLPEDQNVIMTVRGPVSPDAMGKSLIHEHILVDFIGAEKISSKRWNHDAVMQKLLPLLIELKRAGYDTFIDCTPNYLGRDVSLLKKISERCSMNIITNTGYYGGSDNKFLPPHAFRETADELAARWISEFENGIDSTAIRPGFIKISVNNSSLSEISTKLIRAAAITHKHTGLTIASHTGPALPAFEQLEILKENDVRPEAFVWVHAQGESDRSYYRGAAKKGCWVSLDGVSTERLNEYTGHLIFMKEENCLDRTLISHDAGWYDPEQKEGGRIRGYTTIQKHLIPALRDHGFTDEELKQLLIINPKNAFTIEKKLIGTKKR